MEKDYIVNNNFLQIQQGGHCFYCHADFTEKIFEHDCWEKKKDPLGLTSCTDKCKDSPYLKGRTTGNLTSIPPTKAPSWQTELKGIWNNFNDDGGHDTHLEEIE